MRRVEGGWLLTGDEAAAIHYVKHIYAHTDYPPTVAVDLLRRSMRLFPKVMGREPRIHPYLPVLLSEVPIKYN